MDRSRRADLAAVLIIYVVPLTAALVFLLTAGLEGLALALLLVELVVLGAVLWAKRAP